MRATRILAGIVSCLAQHVGEVNVVEREDFSNHVEHPVGEHSAHLVELLQEAFENSPFDDGLALL